jgi:uncharacterized protein involved in exopolysaccharide biosynthesis
MSSTAAQLSPRPGLLSRTLSNHWSEILAAWILGSAALVYFVYGYVKPSYKAYSIVRVVPYSSGCTFGVRGVDYADPWLATMGIQSTSPKILSAEPPDPEITSLVNLIMSPVVLRDAAADPQVASLPRIKASGDPAREIRKNLAVGVIPGTYLIEVSMTSNDPAEAAVVVNSVVEAFIKSSEEITNGVSRKQIKSLENYLAELKNQTDELELKWKELVAKSGVDIQLPKKDEGPPGPDRITIDEYKKVRGELVQVKIDLAQAEAWLDAARAAASRVGKVPAPDDVEEQIKRRLQADPEIATLTGKRLTAEGKVTEARRIAKDPSDPAVVAALRKVASIQKEYRDLYTTKSRAFLKEIEQGGDTRMNLDREIREATLQVEKLKTKRDTLIQHCEKLELTSTHITTETVDITLLLDKRESLRTMQEAVNRRLEQIKFEAKGETRITQMNKAAPPATPISDSRPMLMLIIPIAMFLGVFGLYTGYEGFFGSKVTSV